ncbi:MAG TPA: DUF4350 domain-containing protein [Polyangia bacterium]|nr:DUF4350 domain-containing protein [Polyangia bacterium]
MSGLFSPSVLAPPLLAPAPEPVRVLAHDILAGNAYRDLSEGGVVEGVRQLAAAAFRFAGALPPLARGVAYATALGALVALILWVVRSQRALWGGLTLLAVLAAGLAAAAARGGAPLTDGTHPGSSYDVGLRGTRALALLLARLGARVERVEQPWPPPPSVRVLLVLAPTEPPDGAEIDELGRWIERGGTLLIALGSGPFGETLGLDQVLGFELHEVEVFGRLRAQPVGERFEVELPAGRLLRGRDLVALVEADRGALCARRPRGAGSIVACAGAFPFSNDGLGQADNAAFAARLIARAAGGGAIGFDEFHHGYGARQDGARLLARSPVGWALVQAALAALLWALAIARRLGPPLAGPWARSAGPDAPHPARALADQIERLGA